MYVCMYLGLKVLRTLHFLTHRTLIHGFGTTMPGPSPRSPLVKVVVKLEVRNDSVGFQFAFGGNGEYF